VHFRFTSRQECWTGSTLEWNLRNRLCHLDDLHLDYFSLSDDEQHECTRYELFRRRDRWCTDPLSRVVLLSRIRGVRWFEGPVPTVVGYTGGRKWMVQKDVEEDHDGSVEKEK
jgi:hypothetical protein